jgi:hypothetical protein
MSEEKVQDSVQENLDIKVENKPDTADSGLLQEVMSKKATSKELQAKLAEHDTANEKTRQKQLSEDGKKDELIAELNSKVDNLTGENTRLSKYENDEKTSSSREHFKGRSISYGGEGCVQSTWQSEDVSNSNSRLRGGRGAEFQSGDDGQWGFYSKKEKQTRDDIRSKVIGCDVVSGKTTVQHSNNQRCEESNISKKSNKKDIHSGEYDSTTENKTWWQTQSSLCGVPNGVSYELDKDRANRIKSLGNSIVPPIARQLGLAIMKAELDETS